jgi:hypothetical protein
MMLPKGVKRLLLQLGHVQAQIILFLLFWLIITPYAIILRVVKYKFLPESGWVSTEGRQSLEKMRRMF